MLNRIFHLYGAKFILVCWVGYLYTFLKFVSGEGARAHIPEQQLIIAPGL